MPPFDIFIGLFNNYIMHNTVYYVSLNIHRQPFVLVRIADIFVQMTFVTREIFSSSGLRPEGENLRLKSDFSEAR